MYKCHQSAVVSRSENRAIAAARNSKRLTTNDERPASSYSQLLFLPSAFQFSSQTICPATVHGCGRCRRTRGTSGNALSEENKAGHSQPDHAANHVGHFVERAERGR